MANNVQLWTAGVIKEIPSNIKMPAKIVEYATQLSSKDKTQIANGFKTKSYEMTMTYVWKKSMSSLKRELASVGTKFLGEILGKGHLDDSDNATSVISDEEAIMLAEEFGVVSTTEAMRLRHANELIAHFVDREGHPLESNDGMEEPEAVNALKVCVRNILGKDKVEISTKFAEFRSSLESQIYKEEDDQIQQLKISPYFFKRITIQILLSIAIDNIGAKQENALANLNVILPVLWPTLGERERYLLGQAYADAYAHGAATATSGLKRALLKVRGFDFVPENLRSNTFIRAAEKLIEAHEGMNNFYNEPAPMRDLRMLGTTIPAAAFYDCATAIMCIYLGNSYGVSWSAVSHAAEMFNNFSGDRWNQYFSQCFPSDAKILNKLAYERPRARFMELVEKYKLDELNADGKVQRLLKAASEKDAKKVGAISEQLRSEYYGK